MHRLHPALHPSDPEFLGWGFSQLQNSCAPSHLQAQRPLPPTPTTTTTYPPLPPAMGSDTGSGFSYPSGLCTLKYQPLQPGTEPSYYARGSIVPWTSGYIS